MASTFAACAKVDSTMESAIVKVAKIESTVESTFAEDAKAASTVESTIAEGAIVYFTLMIKIARMENQQLLIDLFISWRKNLYPQNEVTWRLNYEKNNADRI